MSPELEPEHNRDGFEALGIDTGSGCGSTSTFGSKHPWWWILGFLAALAASPAVAILSITQPWLSDAERIQVFHSGCYDETGDLCGDDSAILALIENNTGLGLPEGSQLLYSSSGAVGLHHRRSSAIVRVPAGSKVLFPDNYLAVKLKSFTVDPEKPARLHSDVAVLLESYGLERVIETRDSWMPDGPRKSTEASVAELKSSGDRLVVIETSD